MSRYILVNESIWAGIYIGTQFIVPCYIASGHGLRGQRLEYVIITHTFNYLETVHIKSGIDIVLEVQANMVAADIPSAVLNIVAQIFAAKQGKIHK